MANDKSISPVLELEYHALLEGYHKIADFRHKLLALLPLGSTVAIGVLAGIAKDAETAGSAGQLLDEFAWTIGLFGFVVTLGLYFFEWRQVDRCIAYIAGVETWRPNSGSAAAGSSLFAPVGRSASWVQRPPGSWSMAQARAPGRS